MFKAKLKKEEKELLLELSKYISEVDGNVSYEEMDRIHYLRKVYKMKDYEYKGLSIEELNTEFAKLNSGSRVNVLTHIILLVLSDGDFHENEREALEPFLDIISLDSAAKLQKLLDKHSDDELDVKSILFTEVEEVEIYEESVDMMNEFSKKDAKDVDEGLLMKMKRGPIKKVWDNVLKLWYTLNDPNVDKKTKAICVGALVYLITALDVIPDLTPFIGLVDDASIIGLAVTQLAKSQRLKIK